MIHLLQSVFVVSGDSGMRSEIELLLSAQGLYATGFGSAAAYLTCPKPDVPTCLIVDVELPDMSIDDLQRMLADACPSVLMVARHAANVPASAMAGRAAGLITAPFEPRTFLSAVRAAIDLDTRNRAGLEKRSVMRKRLRKLTPREQQVLPLIVSGMLNKQVAAALGLSENTVQIHRRGAMQKMGVVSFADLVRIARILQVGREDSRAR
jgi:FixJ family two-component response regulator